MLITFPILCIKYLCLELNCYINSGIIFVYVYFRAYIANRVTDKLTKVTERIYCCRSGSAADTQAIADIVSYHLGFHG